MPHPAKGVCQKTIGGRRRLQEMALMQRYYVCTLCYTQQRTNYSDYQCIPTATGDGLCETDQLHGVINVCKLNCIDKDFCYFF